MVKFGFLLFLQPDGYRGSKWEKDLAEQITITVFLLIYVMWIHIQILLNIFISPLDSFLGDLSKHLLLPLLVSQQQNQRIPFPKLL